MTLFDPGINPMNALFTNETDLPNDINVSVTARYRWRYGDKRKDR